MKVILVFVFCVLHVSFAQDGVLKNLQTRPLHKPEAQNNPMIIPVPVFAPVQQYPIQQYPPIQQFPVQQYPMPQFIPVQHIPAQYPQYQVQHYPQMHHPPHYYPQFSHGIPC